MHCLSISKLWVLVDVQSQVVCAKITELLCIRHMHVRCLCDATSSGILWFGLTHQRLRCNVVQKSYKMCRTHRIDVSHQFTISNGLWIDVSHQFPYHLYVIHSEVCTHFAWLIYCISFSIYLACSLVGITEQNLLNLFRNNLQRLLDVVQGKNNKAYELLTPFINILLLDISMLKRSSSGRRK
jgi:hypothetical protein